MPQSLSYLLIHAVFSTKDRAPVLVREVRPMRPAYLATVVRNADCEYFRVGGVADRVHLAIRLVLQDQRTKTRYGPQNWLSKTSRARAAKGAAKGLGFSASFKLTCNR